MAEWHQLSPGLARHLTGALNHEKALEQALFDREAASLGLAAGALLVLRWDRPVKLYQVRKALEASGVTPPAAMVYLEEKRELVLLADGQERTPGAVAAALREGLPRTRFWLGVSDPVTPGTLLARYEGACRALDGAFYAPQTTVFSQEQAPRPGDPAALPAAQRRLSGVLLSGGTEEECSRAAEAFLACLEQARFAPARAAEEAVLMLRTVELMLRCSDPLCALGPDWFDPAELRACRTFRQLGELFSGLVLTLSRSDDTGADRVDGSIRQVMEYLNGHLDEIPSLDVIAREFRINKFVFCRRFKAQTGQTFGAYIKTRRVQEASRLLRETDLRVYEIAERVGYRDVGSFSSFFKRCTGKSPREFRGR